MNASLPSKQKFPRSNTLVILLAAGFLLLIGCGGSQESTQTAEDTALPPDTATVVVDSTMVAPDTTVIATPDTAQATVATPTNEELLLKEIEQLKSDNIEMKQKLDASEQSNKDLMAKISDLESAQLAAREQAVKAPSTQAMTKAVKGKKAPAGKSSDTELEGYETGVAYAKESKFKEAVNQFQSLLNAGIKEDYADNCHYWMGLSYLGLKDYKTALDQFKEVLKFKVSEKRDDAQLMIAKTYERMGNRQQAQAEYRKLVEQYPNSEYVKAAQAKLK
jgi:TolA-binding protein